MGGSSALFWALAAIFFVLASADHHAGKKGNMEIAVDQPGRPNSGVKIGLGGSYLHKAMVNVFNVLSSCCGGGATTEKPVVTTKKPEPYKPWGDNCVLDASAEPCKYSIVDEDIAEIMEPDGSCLVKKPERWEEWVAHHNLNASTSHYFDDPDSDGLVNILEFWGIRSQIGQNLSGLPIGDIGLNPLNGDYDKDLLVDGFEWYSKLNPKVKDNITADYDNDKLTNLQEQIWCTDPNNGDSDGDGKPDGEEVEDGADPKDEGDKGKPSDQDATLELTVGDFSGSHSERYWLHVGHISHQAPQHGVVNKGLYTFKPGTYRITIEHIDSNLRVPDYDYVAALKKINGTANVRIEDPQKILIYSHHSSFFFAKDKSALLIVESTCNTTTDARCACEQHTNCTSCFADSRCTYTNNQCQEDTKGDARARNENRLVCLADEGNCDFYNHVDSDFVSCGDAAYAKGYGYNICKQKKMPGVWQNEAGAQFFDKANRCMMSGLIPCATNPSSNCALIEKHGLETHPFCLERSGLCNVITSNWPNFNTAQSDRFSQAVIQHVVKGALRCSSTVQAWIKNRLMSESAETKALWKYFSDNA